VRPERHYASAAPVPHRRIDDTIEALAASRVGQGIASRISDIFVRMQALWWGIDTPQIDKLSGKTCEHFCIFDYGIEISGSL
jgi:hypothetical protein